MADVFVVRNDSGGDLELFDFGLVLPDTVAVDLLDVDKAQGSAEIATHFGTGDLVRLIGGSPVVAGKEYNAEHTHDFSDMADGDHAASHEVGGGDLVNHDDLTGFVASEHWNGNDAGTGSNEVFSAQKINAELSALSSGIIRKKAVIDYVDCTAAPPTEVLDDRYIIDFTGGTVHANWDGAAKGDIVDFNGTTWDAETPAEGWTTYVDLENKDRLYVDDGAPAWELRAPYPGAHALGGAEHTIDSLANLNSKITGVTLDDSGDPRDPNAHVINPVSGPHTGTLPESVVTFNASTGHDHDGSGSMPVDHVDLSNKGTNTHAQIDTALGKYDEIEEASLNPSGFADRADSSLGLATRTVTITGTDFVIFCKGTKYLRSTDNITVPATIGLHLVYYDESGVLSSQTGAWEFDDGRVLICYVYWNGVEGVLTDERHTIKMPRQTHHYLHETIGARYESGFAGSFDNTSFSLAAGKYFDEDIEWEIGAETTCRVLYRSGSDWLFTAAQAAYFKLSGSPILEYDNAGSLTEITNNWYMAMWVAVSNDPTDPIWVIMGQRQDNNLNNARLNNTLDSLSLGTLPSQEMKLLYRVIIRRNGAGITYQETEDYRAVSNLPAGEYTPTDHGTLSGLADDDHTQYLLTNGTRAMGAGLDMGANAITNVGNVDGVDVSAHASRHENTGADEISVAGLSGELADDQPPKAHASSHVPGASDPVFRSMEFFGDQLDNVVPSEYPVSVVAPVTQDDNNNALAVRAFDDTTEEGVGLILQIPEGATNIVFDFVSRAWALPGGAVGVVPKLYVREIPDNAAVESWSAGADMTALAFTTNENYQYDNQSIALTTLGLVAGRIAQFEITRNTGAGGDDLSGDWALLLVKVSFT